MEPAVPLGEDGTAPQELTLQTTVALSGDGTDIAQARHLAAGFLTLVQAEHGLPISQRAMDLTQ
ncbi:ATP-binding protein, partial [Streptomyces sp. NPDC001215]